MTVWMCPVICLVQRPDKPVHSQKELAHWTVDVTVQNYACCFSG